MEKNPNLVYQQIEEIEEMAEKILIIKDELIDLDKKRNKNREALRAISNNAKKGESSKEWVCFGSMFIKLDREKASKIIKNDQDLLEEAVSNHRNELKNHVNTLRDMEGKPELKGFNLKSLSQNEKAAIGQIMGL